MKGGKKVSSTIIIVVDASGLGYEFDEEGQSGRPDTYIFNIIQKRTISTGCSRDKNSET